MDLSLNGTQLMVRKAVRSFAREALEEWAGVLDRESRPLPSELTAEMGRINLWGIQAPREYGGADLDGISFDSTVWKDPDRSHDLFLRVVKGLGEPMRNSATVIVFADDLVQNAIINHTQHIIHPCAQRIQSQATKSQCNGTRNILAS